MRGDEIIDNRGDKKESLFMITVNTNRTPISGAQRQMFETIIMEAVKKFREIETRRDLINFLNKDTLDSFSVDSEEIKVGFEMGSKQSRFHAHIVWDFVHYSKIQLDVHALKQLFLEKFYYEYGWANIHLDVKAVSNVKRNLEEYAKKQDSEGKWNVYNVHT